MTGRDTEWARLLTDIQNDYIDPDTDQPQPGRDDVYNVITQYRVQIAQARRDWPTATHLQTTAAAWNRNRASSYLDLPPRQLDSTGEHRLRNLAASEHHLGELLRQQGDPACRQRLQTAYDLFERIGDAPALAIAAFSLGRAHLDGPELWNLDQANYWAQMSLDLAPEHDMVLRAATHSLLASVAFERFLDAQASGLPTAQVAPYREQARAGHQQALDLLPDDHHDYRATAHSQLGRVHSSAGEVPRALGHFQQAIRHREASGGTYGAGESRFNIALLLRDNGRAADALHYARAALANFQQVGPGAASAAGRAEALIQELERREAP